jgi:hypothetical protein
MLAGLRKKRPHIRPDFNPAPGGSIVHVASFWIGGAAWYT